MFPEVTQQFFHNKWSYQTFLMKKESRLLNIARPNLEMVENTHSKPQDL